MSKTSDLTDPLSTFSIKPYHVNVSSQVTLEYNVQNVKKKKKK